MDCWWEFPLHEHPINRGGRRFLDPASPVSLTRGIHCWGRRRRDSASDRSGACRSRSFASSSWEIAHLPSLPSLRSRRKRRSHGRSGALAATRRSSTASAWQPRLSGDQPGSTADPRGWAQLKTARLLAKRWSVPEVSPHYTLQEQQLARLSWVISEHARRIAVPDKRPTLSGDPPCL